MKMSSMNPKLAERSKLRDLQDRLPEIDFNFR